MSQPRCCIVICRNAKAGADRRVGYHSFPADETLRAKWIEFVGVANPERFRWRNKYVCSAHFLHSELIGDGSGGRGGLSEGAVPMVFAPEGEDDEEGGEEVEYLERDDVMVSDKPPGEVVEAKLTPDGPIVSSVVEEVELRALFCRICLKKQPDLLPLGSKLHNAPLSDVIFTIAGIRLGVDEQLPTKICARCIEKADMAFNVRMEFIHYERILRNLVKNKQLETHYQSYDQQLHETRSFNEDYLNSLLANVKQEVTEPKMEFTFEDTELGANADEDASYFEEHLYEEVNPEPDTESTYGHPLSVPPSEERETYVVANNSANVMRAVHSQETDDGGEPTEKEPQKEAKPQKFVFSWKELYKPKSTPKPKKKRKIVGFIPKPDLVPNTCYYCNTVHPDPEALEAHLEQHVGELPYTCHQCHSEQFPAIFKTLVSLNKHLMSHQFPYRCDYCWQRQATEVAYETHMQNSHEDSGDGFTCHYCGIFFGAKTKFRNHIAKHRAVEQGRYKCEFCDRVFGNSSLLKRHRRIHTGEKPFECNKCGKKFNHEANFRNHKRSHIGEKAYVCEECGKNFINSTALRYHMAEHYPDDPQYRVQQNIPRTRYNDASSSSVSKMNAVGVREYRCDVEGCAFVTTLYRAYFYHRNVHLRRYECETCGKRFPMKATLKKHQQQVHQGVVPEKNLPCPYCAKMFSEKQKLQMHVDIHENNRKYRCRFCEKTFIQKVNCTAHERIHTGERPYICRFCPAGFITSSGRKKHEKTHPELTGEDDNQKPQMVEIIQQEQQQQQQQFLEVGAGGEVVVDMDVLGAEEEEHEEEGDDVVYDEEVHEEDEDYEIEVAEELEATEEEMVEFTLEENSRE
uniref:Putative c2h2-type zn-finger protein n=1 Tax=Culex tarsalis TaxID=7177 RepID=A0A1Q3EZ52_CULTA